LLDANTFTNHQISAYLNDNFINLKIDAETPYGQKLFSQFNGEGYPLILFLDQKQKELDRFYGFYKPKNFLEKLKAIIEGGNTFSNLFQKYELGDRSSETISLLAKKYAERNENNAATELYRILMKSKNVSHTQYHEAKYFIAVQSMWNQGSDSLELYLNKNPDSPFIKESANELNDYAWKLAISDENLKDALEKINIALKFLDQSEKQYANILDTKAEILWKSGDNQEAIVIINQAIEMDPLNEYYHKQKQKILDTIIN